MASAPGGDSSDRGILDELFRKYSERLRLFLLRRTRNRQVAEDLAQAAFERLLARGDLATLGDLKKYLYRVAINLLTKYRMQQTVEASVALDAEEPDALALPDDSDAIQPEELERALQRLTPRQLSMIQLRSMGFRYREIATMLDVSEAVVGQDLMNARQKLREELLSSGQGKV